MTDRVLVDLHSGAMGAVEMSEVLFANASAVPGVGAMNCEVNAGIHTMRRAITEAIDLNAFFNDPNPNSAAVPSRIWGCAPVRALCRFPPHCYCSLLIRP